jgi:hypothetical protein
MWSDGVLSVAVTESLLHALEAMCAFLDLPHHFETVTFSSCSTSTMPSVQYISRLMHSPYTSQLSAMDPICTARNLKHQNKFLVRILAMTKEYEWGVGDRHKNKCTNMSDLTGTIIRQTEVSKKPNILKYNTVGHSPKHMPHSP